MSTDDRGLFPPNPKRDRRDDLTEALSAFSSNLGAALGHTTSHTRFFKVQRRDDDSWLAMIGMWNEDREPIIFFGNGEGLLKAVQRLGQSMAADAWKEDKYA